MYMQSSSKSMVFLAVTLTVLLGYNFIGAAWSDPSSAPPNDNTEAPINVGSEIQVKTGVLGLNGLAIFGNQAITSANPQIKFDDTDAGQTDFWTHANNDKFYILSDRNGDGSYNESADTPHPMVINATENKAEDYAKFAGQVRATQYCDENGENCLDASTVDTNAPVIKSGSATNPEVYNRQTDSGDNEYVVHTYTVTFDKSFTIVPAVTLNPIVGSTPSNYSYINNINVSKSGISFQIYYDDDVGQPHAPSRVDWIAIGS